MSYSDAPYELKVPIGIVFKIYYATICQQWKILTIFLVQMFMSKNWTAATQIKSSPSFFKSYLSH